MVAHQLCVNIENLKTDNTKCGGGENGIWQNGNWQQKDSKCTCQFVNARYPFWSKTLYDKIDLKVA
jgi:hypothetical protein